MQKRYKIIYLISICFAIAESDYVKIFQGKDAIDLGKNYQNPEWSFDSRVFTVEMHMGSSRNKTFKLYLGNVDELESFSELIPEPSKKNKSGFGKARKVRERNLGWLDIDDEYVFYGTMDKSNKIRECSLYDNSLEIYPMEEFEDQEVRETPLEDLELNFPLREYTMSKNNIYFTTYSDPRRVWLLSNEQIYSILAYGDEESQKLFDIPVVSLSASLNDDRILLVSYNENQSEIIRLDKNENNSSTKGIKKYIKTNIKKPQSDKMNYLYGILDPHNDERYLLIARKQSDGDNNDSGGDSGHKNLADVFVRNGENLEGKFVMYRSFEDNYLYNNPEVQFHPTETDHIYFIDNNRNLSYWNGKKIVRKSLDLENVMNFKFSPNGEYLVATTADIVPEDLYLYEVTK